LIDERVEMAAYGSSLQCLVRNRQINTNGVARIGVCEFQLGIDTAGQRSHQLSAGTASVYVFSGKHARQWHSVIFNFDEKPVRPRSSAANANSGTHASRMGVLDRIEERFAHDGAYDDRLLGREQYARIQQKQHVRIFILGQRAAYRIDDLAQIYGDFHIGFARRIRQETVEPSDGVYSQ
jgi:hypothetical protein